MHAVYCFFALCILLLLTLHICSDVCIIVINQGGPASALTEAEVPLSALRVNLSEKDGVLEVVKGY